MTRVAMMISVWIVLISAVLICEGTIIAPPRNVAALLKNHMSKSSSRDNSDLISRLEASLRKSGVLRGTTSRPKSDSSTYPQLMCSKVVISAIRNVRSEYKVEITEYKKQIDLLTQEVMSLRAANETTL